MPEPAHRIGRQRWELRVSDPATGFGARSLLRRDLESVILPAFERAFDSLGLHDRVLRLPRLEIDLRVGSLRELQERLPEFIAQSVQKAVAEELARSKNGERIEADEPPLLSLLGHAQAVLLDYLRGGHLSQLSTAPTLEAHRAELADAAVRWVQRSQVDVAIIKQACPHEYAQAFAFFHRLLVLLPDHVRLAWIVWIEAQAAQRFDAPKLRQNLPTLRQRLHQGYVQPRLVEALVAALYYVPSSSWRELIRHAVEMMALAPGDGDFVALASFVTNEATLAVVQSPHARDDVISAEMPERSEAPASKPEAAQSSARYSSEPARPSDDLASGRLLAPIWALNAKSVDTSSQAWNIPAAGLVLVHPFLPAIFAEFGLFDGASQEIRPRDLSRAAALLHCIAYGDTEVHEYQLGISKILLGRSLDDAVLLREGLLEPAQRGECEALLKAMIGHWPALRDTSADGLRSSFLQRNGLLRRTDRGFHLLIESASFDVLLNFLPWSISIIKLPWMPRPLFTDWPPP
jgi:hypothetical protein